MPPSPPSFRFWQTFNPISTRMGRLCPPHYYLPPPPPDYFQTFLRPCMYMTVVNVISLRFPIVFKVGSRGPCPLGQLVVSNLNFPPKQSRKCRHLNAMFFSSNHSTNTSRLPPKFVTSSGNVEKAITDLGSTEQFCHFAKIFYF